MRRQVDHIDVAAGTTHRLRMRKRAAPHLRPAGIVGDEVAIDHQDRHVAQRIGKFARPRRVIWAGDLPKTRSGKIMRRLLRDIAEGRELGDVTTLRDPDVMDQLQERIRSRAGEED